jgi:hypothetical protein
VLSSPDPRSHRRIVVLAAGTLAVATLSGIAPVPQVVAAPSTSSSTSATTAAGAIVGTVTARTVTRTSTAPKLRPKPVVRTTSKTAVAPYAFGTAAYAQWHAKRIMASRYGWRSTSQFTCLVNLWNRESHWNYRSHNRSSGAHGIPQALPGSKMGNVAPDWRTNPVTQVRWGLGYIKSRYGSPCGAWRHFQSHSWY